MAEKFIDQVEGLTNLVIGTTPTTTDFDTFLADGVRDVTERVLRFRPNLAPSFSNTVSLENANGYDLDGAQVLGVSRENGTAEEFIVAEPINFNQRFITKDPTSLSYKSKFNPAWYEYEGKIYTVPDAGDSDNRAFITYVSFTAPGNQESTIAYFPNKYEPLVALYAAAKVVEVNISSVTLPPDLSVNIPVPVTISGPSFSSDDAEIQNAVNNFTKTLSGIAPTYNYNNTLLGLTGLQDFLAYGSFTELAPKIYNVEQPLPIPQATLSYDGPISTLVQYSDVGERKIRDRVVSVTPPEYQKPILALTTWSFTESPDTSHLTPPDPAPLTLFHTDFSAAGDPPTLWDPESEDSAGTNLEVEGLVWGVFNQALLEDDFDKAAAELTKITQITSLRQDEFNKNMEVYKENIGRISEKLADSDKTWGMNLARFSADLGKYQADVNNVFTKWTHDFNRESTKFTQENTHIMSQLTQEITSSLNDYNRDKALYDAEVAAITKDIENAFSLAVKNSELEDELELQNAINAAKKEVDQWQTALKRYELSMTKYTTDVSANLETYKVDLNKELDKWKTRQWHLLGKYKDDITQASKVFDAENAAYQASLQRDISELTSTAEASVQKMDLSTNVDLTNKAQKLQGEIQKYSAEMDKYVGEVGAYEKAVATRIQEYTSEVQSKTTEYTWLVEQYNRLKQEYETAFMVMSPQATAAPK